MNLKKKNHTLHSHHVPITQSYSSQSEACLAVKYAMQMAELYLKQT